MEEGQPLYISMEGLCDSSSQSEGEDDTNDEITRSRRFSRKMKQVYFPDFDIDADKENPVASGDSPTDEKVVALSKKQLNRLAAMEIYPIPSGGIGTVNASLFNPVTIKWLMKNFETVEGSSLPRYLVYNHYLLHCKSLNIKPINAASFGKVIRSVFLGLQTRRLGTRGNSKYHYCGMRIKPDSPLLHVVIGDTEIKKPKAGILTSFDKSLLEVIIPPKATKINWTVKSFQVWNTKYCQGLPSGYLQFRFQQNENENTMRHLKPDLDLFIPVTEGLSKDDIATFKRYYHEHCNDLLSAVISFKLEEVGLTWQAFYKTEKHAKIPAGGEEGTTNPECTRPFTRNKLKKFVSNRNIQKFINEMDKQTYTSMALLLCPHVTVVVPREVNQMIRNFLGIAEEWLLDALENYPEDFLTVKIKTLQNVMRPLEQTLNTNSFYGSMQTGFTRKDKVDQLLTALKQMNLAGMNLRIGWKAEKEVFDLLEELKDVLEKPNCLPLVVHWVEKLVESTLASKAPTLEFKMNLQNTFLGLSYYLSLVKSEILLTCPESLELFTSVESFVLEYLKYFMHLRTGMQNLIASALASATCNDESNDFAHKVKEVNEENSELFTKTEESSARFEAILPDTVKQDVEVENDENVDPEEDLSDIELEELEKFLSCEVDDFADDCCPNPWTSDDDLLLPTDLDECFKKYFSSSGYVTNYFCQKFMNEEDDLSIVNEDHNRREKRKK